MIVALGARCLAVLAAASAMAGALLWVAAPDLAEAHHAWADGQLGTQPVPRLVVWLAASVLAACALWLWTVAVAVVVQAGLGRPRVRVPWCPRLLRRAILAACGLAVAGSLGVPVGAATRSDDGGHDPVREPVPTTTDASPGLEDEYALLEGLPLPDRVASRPAGPQRSTHPPTSQAQPSQDQPARHPAAGSRRTGPAVPPAQPAAHPLGGTARASVPPAPSPDQSPAGEADRPPGDQDARWHLVVPGDTLWDLGAATLPAGADVADISRRWRAIYAANRAVIGPDPDLILPQQRLRIPHTEPGDPR